MTFEVDFRRKTRKTCVSPERFLRPANAKGAEGHRYECRKTPKMREKRPRGPKNAMAGVENKWAKSGHLRNRSIPSGEAFKTPEKTCQSASKRTDFRPCSPVPHPPQRKARSASLRRSDEKNCSSPRGNSKTDVKQGVKHRRAQRSRGVVRRPLSPPRSAGVGFSSPPTDST